MLLSIFLEPNPPSIIDHGVIKDFDVNHCNFNNVCVVTFVLDDGEKLIDSDVKAVDNIRLGSHICECVDDCPIYMSGYFVVDGGCEK